MKKTWTIIGGLVIVAIVIAVVVRLWFGGSLGMSGFGGLGGGANSGKVVRVVAAENFYGDIAAQLGGSHVSVDSLLSNPNVDPHEYESSVADGIAIADANVVIKNGLTYDTWIDKLISASPNASRVVVTAGDDATRLLPDNPHIWYGIDNIAAIARAIANAYEQVDPADSADYEANLVTFDNSLAPLNAKIAEIKSHYGSGNGVAGGGVSNNSVALNINITAGANLSGVPVGLTETIYLYQTEPMGLDVLTPFNFEKAVAEGNDPSAQDVATTNQQIASGAIRVLIYNEQTVTPITTNLQNLAQKNNIPIVPVTETMPAGMNYQTWMMGEMDALEAALGKK